MSPTEIGPNLAEFRTTLRDKLASMPPVGTQGREIKTPTDDAEVDHPDIVPPLGIYPEPPAPRMKPNPAQGASATSRAPVTAQPTASTPLERIRALSSDIADPTYDPTL
jgi:hypothetical protein